MSRAMRRTLPWLVGVAGVVLGGVALAAGPPAAIRSTARVRLDASQREAARIIVVEAARWCAAHGLPRGKALGAVMLANAYGESRLRTSAKGDRRADGTYCSRGLFQLNTCAGVGARLLSANPSLKPDDLHDPILNTRGILTEVARSATLLTALRSGTMGQAVKAFVYEVERPADKEGDTAKRITFLRQLVGAGPDLPCATFEASAAFKL